MLDIIIITTIVAIEGQIAVAKCTENAWDDGFLEAVLNVREKKLWEQLKSIQCETFPWASVLDILQQSPSTLWGNGAPSFKKDSGK